MSTPAFAQPTAKLPTPLNLLRDRPMRLIIENAPVPQDSTIRRLSAKEAVDLALEQNLSIQVERLNPLIDDLSVAEARSAWTPNFTSGLSGFSRDIPANSFLSGGKEQVSDDELGANVSVNQFLPWGGASYSASWDSLRSKTTNTFSSFNPVLRTNFNLNFVQPLLRNFKIDSSRYQLLISSKNREVSDVQLRETVVQTIRQVKNAYWDLVYAISFLEVQEQSLDLAKESLKNNKIRVKVGTMAPIDIIEAEVEVARNEESRILAKASIERAEDQLRLLIFNPNEPELWNLRLIPTDSPILELSSINTNDAIRNALDKRTDLQQAQKNVETLDININYFKNQVLPQVNFEANYGLTGLGGNRLLRGDGFPGPVIGESRRNFSSVLLDLLKNDFPTWTMGLTVSYPLGTSAAETRLERIKLQRTQLETQIKNLEFQVTTQVRDLARQVNTYVKRIEATQSVRTLAEQRLGVEQKKFEVGISTSFMVFQAQRDLLEARNNEVGTILDYNQSLVDFEAIQETSIGTGSGITIVAPTQNLEQPSSELRQIPNLTSQQGQRQ
jgi:outer membrane protein TolC